MNFFSLIFLILLSSLLSLVNSLIPVNVRFNLLKYAKISKETYSFETSNLKIARVLDYDFVNYHNFKNNLGCLILDDKKDKNLIIGFKGTTKLEDWKYNFDFFQTKINDVYIHKGYYRILQENKMIEMLEKEIDKYDSDYNIHFCGHSAGGAKSLIVSYFLADKFKNRNFKIFTYGSPRVGNINFVKKFNQLNNVDHYRVSYNNDIVTAFPLLNYRHVDKSYRLKYLKNKKKIIDFGNYNKLTTFSLFKCNSVLDHNIDNYINFIDEYNKNLI